VQAILFDLDDTLIPDRAAERAAFVATAAFAASRLVLDPARLATAASIHAIRLWNEAPERPCCTRRGIGHREALWCRVWGGSREDGIVRACMARYKSAVWARALSEQGIEDTALAKELGSRFEAERRTTVQPFSEARAVLAGLRGHYLLGLVTNGEPGLQREKLASVGLSEYFITVVVSGDIGIAKPDPEIFRRALDELAVSANQAFMVGDSLTNDAAGAVACGIKAIWVNRTQALCRETRGAVAEIADLAELPRVLVKI
jgi:putative hydrolase of the HAD superfamily